MRARVLLPLVLAFGALAGLGAAGSALFSCSGSGTHAFPARPYDEARDCLADPTAIDAIEGSDPGLACALKCALSPTPGESGAPVAYISTECPPYPPDFDTTGLRGDCPAALAAARREDYCLPDGGSTNPAPRDGGSDAPSSGDDASDGASNVDANDGASASDAPPDVAGNDASDGAPE